MLAGAPSEQVPELLGELEAAGVFSRTKDGVIYSRKMTRMAKKAAVARKNGKSGGNPKLCNESGNYASDNLKDKGQDKPQKPEARSQTEKVEANASTERSRFEEFWQAYPHRGGVKKGKAPAVKSYDRAVRSGVSQQSIIDGAKASKAHPDVVRGYARDPLTWLNQRGWLDELGSPPSERSRFHAIASNYG